jgi:hypothetical protein
MNPLVFLLFCSFRNSLCFDSIEEMNLVLVRKNLAKYTFYSKKKYIVITTLIIINNHQGCKIERKHA